MRDITLESVATMTDYFVDAFFAGVYIREFHNKVPPDKMPLLCRKICVINKPFTENIVYICL